MSEPTRESPPEWAVLYVRGAVRIGVHAREIAEHLMGRGVSSEMADRLIMETIEEMVETSAPPEGLSDRGKPMRLALCTAIGAASLFLAYWFGTRVSVPFALLWVVPALFCIWVPELTDTHDSSWGSRSWLTGWFLLLLYLGYRIFFAVMLAN